MGERERVGSYFIRGQLVQDTANGGLGRVGLDGTSGLNEGAESCATAAVANDF